MTTFTVWYRKKEMFILGLTGLILVTLLWQAICSLGLINPFLLSSPYQILLASIEQTINGALWAEFRITIIEFLIAFGASVVVGVSIGLLMGWFQRVEYVLDPFVWFKYSTPTIAFYPLLIIWLGLGFNTVVMLGFLLGLIPIIINTIAGVKSTNPVLIKAAQSFGASKRQILFKIALPSAIPLIVTGCRIGVERALLGVIVGELFGSNSGLGFQIAYYGAKLQTPKLFVSLVLVILLGLLLTQLVRIVETRLLKWQE